MEKDSKNYLRFGLMILTSMVVMYILTYVNVFQLTHIRWSETRLYMIFIMGAAMATIMLCYMIGMYKDSKKNIAIFTASALVAIVALWFLRTQSQVEDTSYMRAMIPHHSIAILTSERAKIKDKRVQELAKKIADSQRQEIKEMSWLVDDIAKNGIAGTDAEAEDRKVPEFSGQP